jgi:hypothetical protein
MSRKKKILWFAYPSETWAFEIRTHNLIKRLPEYDHQIFIPVKNLKLIEQMINGVDIVFIWHDVSYSQISERSKKKIIQLFSGVRMLKKINEVEEKEAYKKAVFPINKILKMTGVK